MPVLAAVPVPDDFEVRTNATFEALMWALSRPGTVQTLPVPGMAGAGRVCTVPVPGMAGIAEALLDRECRVFCEDAALGDQIAPFGAMQVPLPLADHAFLSLADLERVGQVQVQVGSDLYPDEGATVVAPATFGTGQRLRLTGPGIETATEIAIDGLAHGFWSLRAARCRYPAGFELFLICGAKVIGLPRSTMIEVL